MIADTPVRVDRDGPVAVVTLSRPGKSNAMDGETTEALLAALGSLSARGDVGAMVLTGQGGAFSAGGDVQTIKEMGRDRMFRDAILSAHQRLFHTMTRLPFASVAAVNGAAVGAGVTAALMCDLVVMADTAFLSDPRVSLGLLDGAGGIVLWPLLTSLSAAKEYLLLGERLGGDEAHRLGLVNRVVPQEDVHAEALRLAHRLAALPGRPPLRCDGCLTRTWIEWGAWSKTHVAPSTRVSTPTSTACSWSGCPSGSAPERGNNSGRR